MKKKTLTVKMSLDTILSGGAGREVKRKRWSVKKKLPLSLPDAKKMKRKLKKLTKLMGLFVLSALAVLSVGCGSRGGYTEPEEIAVISAIGIDTAENGISVSVQTVEDGGKNLKVTEGEGESVDLALSLIYGKGSKRYELSHCALVVLGDGLDGDELSDVYEFCNGEDDLSDAVLFVSSHEAKELLAAENAAGYDLASSMRSYPDGNRLFSKNRFYEIRSAEKTAVGKSNIALPYFGVSEGGYYVLGLKIYSGREERVILDREESVLYLMMRGMFTSGRVEYASGEDVSAVSVKSCRTDVEENTVRCRLRLNEEISEGEKERLLSSCRREASELYEELTERYGDLFGYGTDGLEFYFEIDGEI